MAEDRRIYPRRSTTVLGAAILVALTTVAGAQQARVTYDKSLTVKGGKVMIGGKAYDQSNLTKQLSAQLAKANRGIKQINRAALPFTSINVTEDYSATVTCGSGETLTCSIKGPGTCESGSISVACISANTETHDACGPTE